MVAKKKSKWKRILTLLFLIVLSGLFVVLYVLPTVTGALARTSLVEYGRLRVTNQVTGYFMRDETLYPAVTSGTVQYYADEGELVRKGTRIVDVDPRGGDYIAEDACIVSYYTDGLEDYFDPEQSQYLDRDEVEALEIEVGNIKRSAVAAGEPLYKTVENGKWYVVFWIESDLSIQYEEGRMVQLELPQRDVKAMVKRIADHEGYWQILLESDRYYADLATLRKMELTVITSDYEGLLIANKSITSQEGTPGVYIRDIGGDFSFRPVSVVATDGEFSLVREGYFMRDVDGEQERVTTVAAYDEVLNHWERNE